MADKKKKPSGAHFRKRRAETAKEQAKQEGSFLKYLRTQEANPEHEDDCTLAGTSTEGAECDAPTTSDINTDVSEIGDISGKHTEEEEDVNKSESTEKSAEEDVIVHHLDYRDPANWPDCCNDTLRQLIVQHGPQQVVSHDFPKDSNNRRFSPITKRGD